MGWGGVGVGQTGAGTLCAAAVPRSEGQCMNDSAVTVGCGWVMGVEGVVGWELGSVGGGKVGERRAWAWGVRGFTRHSRLGPRPAGGDDE
jgi:hypothetical protein